MDQVIAWLAHLVVQSLLSLQRLYCRYCPSFSRSIGLWIPFDTWYIRPLSKSIYTCFKGVNVLSPIHVYSIHYIGLLLGWMMSHNILCCFFCFYFSVSFLHFLGVSNWIYYFPRKTRMTVDNDKRIPCQCFRHLVVYKYIFFLSISFSPI